MLERSDGGDDAQKDMAASFGWHGLRSENALLRLEEATHACNAPYGSVEMFVTIMLRQGVIELGHSAPSCGLVEHPVPLETEENERLPASFSLLHETFGDLLQAGVSSDRTSFWRQQHRRQQQF